MVEKMEARGPACYRLHIGIAILAILGTVGGQDSISEGDAPPKPPSVTVKTPNVTTRPTIRPGLLTTKPPRPFTRPPPPTTTLPTFTVPPPSRYRLANAAGERGMGRVEAFYNGTWSQLCVRGSWTQKEATVLCRSLGFERGVPAQERTFPRPPPVVLPTKPTPAPANDTLGDERRAPPFLPQPVVPKVQVQFRCQGTEESLDECPGSWVSYCYNSAAVVCVGPHVSADGIEKVRIVPPRGHANGTETSALGRIEVYHRGRWGLVCDSNKYFQDKELKTFCGILGYEHGYKMDAGMFYYPNDYNMMYWLQNIRCGSVTSDINQCLDGTYPGEPHPETSVCQSTYRSVILTCFNASIEYPLSPSAITQVRLVNTTGGGDEDWIMGRVEVKVAGVWGSICQAERYSRNVWMDTQANVTCRMLGYAGGTALISQVFGIENTTVWISKLPCIGYEDSFADCTGRIQAPSRCEKGGAGVFCYSSNVNINAEVKVPVRLDGKPDPHTKKVKAGRVEYFNLGLWGPVCQEGWDLREAYVVCTQLGFKDGYPLCNSSFGVGVGPNWLNKLGCAGNENDLKDCLGWQKKFLEEGGCPSDQQAGVHCVDHEPEGPVSLRLVDKNTPGVEVVSGVVEVMYKGQWGTICSNNWDDNDAKVVCQQLGYVTGSARTNLTIGIGTRMVWLNNVDCRGHEKNITECIHEGWAINRCALACDHSSDAGVTCSGKRKEPTKKPEKNPDKPDGSNNVVDPQVAASKNGGSGASRFSLAHILCLIATWLTLLHIKQQ